MRAEALRRIELAKEKRLDFLDLSGLGLEEIPNELASLPWLKTLSLCENAIRDIRVLGRLRSLHKLALSYNRISDITPLQGLEKLKFLFLSHNEIMDVSVLGELPALKKLVLSGNRIASVEPLHGLCALVYLDLSNNSLDTVEAKDCRAMLPSLLVYKV